VPAKTPSNPIKKVLAAVRRDPQKAGILTVLVAILLVLQMRLRLSSDGGPSKATAAAPTQSGNSTGVLSANHEPTDPATALRAFMEGTIAPVKRNLFVIDLERFPQDNGRTTSANTAGSGFWDELAKSMTARADVKRERQILLENVQQQAAELRLQSTVMGASPRAVIDGELVGEGDVVAAKSGENRVSFRVLKIEARRIIVEREGIKLAIQMK
jgi:hypothetical protein